MPSASSLWGRWSARARRTNPFRKLGAADWSAHRDHRYRVPADLQVTPTPPLNVLMAGSCFLEEVQQALRDAGHRTRLILQSHGSESPLIEPEEMRGYDLQIAQIPTRGLLPDRALMQLRYADMAGYEALFAHSRQVLDLLVDQALTYHRQHALPTLVCNLLRPQQNPLGRLLPKNDIRNPACYVDRLNAILYDRLSGLNDVHVLDIDEISAGFGRMYQQDDQLWSVTHGSIVSDYDRHFDHERLHPPTPLRDIYDLRTVEFMRAVVAEIEASARTLKHIDQVKLVVVDLDDTLWRGVVGETGRPGESEGWPLGLLEALVALRERGVLLAIASKNDAARIEAIWQAHFQDRIDLDAFVVRRIDWRPKAQNMVEILESTNILPRNVVFIDDNPVERAAMTAAFPDIRTLGAEPYLLRRILLWAPETQVARISPEAAARTQTTLATIERNDRRKGMSRAEFLASLDLKVRAFEVVGAGDGRFPRCLELLNRTNQFNTTGVRWSAAELEVLLARGGRLLAFEVEDRFSAYGLTGLALIEGGRIVQVVMSCRVFGMGVESAILNVACRRIAASGAACALAALVETHANGPCRNLFADAAFAFDGTDWTRSLGDPPAAAAHIALSG